MTRAELARRRHDAALAHLRTALATLERATGRDDAPINIESDGPLYWAAAVGAAKARLRFAIGDLEAQ